MKKPGVNLTENQVIPDRPQYKCSICRDFGFVHPLKEDGQPDYTQIVDCDCVKAVRAKMRLDSMVRWCELPEATVHMTFENYKVSPKVKEVYTAALEMAEGKPEKPFLTMMGKSDLGKTHLLVAICRRRLAQGKPARYVYVPILLEELRSGFRGGGDGTYEERWQMFLTVQLLALDDLGTENPTPWVQEHLDTLIDYRLMHALPTVITTNLLPDELTPRIASRLQRAGQVVIVSAPPYSAVKGKAVK
jgi:DNA replication protein DnaC